ncbi:hypothetical protein PR002_g6898 [Phytophthora rubi]|uniref:Uncharacterized protein n=1 Tax=Phytophthora rubi TaxID=129364 RepID=A0A6A3MZH1_9STRA|nr:hypothetical protein PR002_g6898 [Phytophthora rubi]
MLIQTKIEPAISPTTASSSIRTKASQTRTEMGGVVRVGGHASGATAAGGLGGRLDPRADEAPTMVAAGDQSSPPVEQGEDFQELLNFDPLKEGLEALPIRLVRRRLEWLAPATL